MKRKLSLIGNILFVAVVLFLCYYIIMASRNQAPDVFGYRLLRVMSNSMDPVFSAGDCIIVKRTAQEELQVGDIITFVSEDPILQGSFNTHRVIDIIKDRTTGETLYFTKGDSNNMMDDYTVSYGKIVGKYIYRIPFGKSVSAFLNRLSNSNYYFVIVILPILLCLLSGIHQLAKEIKGRRQE